MKNIVWLLIPVALLAVVVICRYRGLAKPAPGPAAVAPGKAEPAKPQAETAPPPKNAPFEDTKPWVLKNETNFADAAGGELKLEPWYTAYTDSSGFFGGLFIHADFNKEQYLRLSERIPHAVKWQLRVRIDWGGKCVSQFTENGTFIQNQHDLAKNVLAENSEHTFVLERAGGFLAHSMDDALLAKLPVPADDRTPLRFASRWHNVHVLESKLYFKKGAELTDAPPPAGAPPDALKNVKWAKVFEDNFETADCLQNYRKLKGGALQWHEKHRALFLQTDDLNGGEIFAALHKPLPGDLRVRFRALRRKPAPELSLGVFFSIRCPLFDEDGYFVEWGGGRIKLNVRAHPEKEAAAPTPQTADRWVNIEIRRVGGQITAFMEGKEVLNYLDPHPLKYRTFDGFSFYIYGDSTLISNLAIERNANDPIKPLADDPLTRPPQSTDIPIFETDF